MKVQKKMLGVFLRGVSASANGINKIDELTKKLDKKVIFLSLYKGLYK